MSFLSWHVLAKPDETVGCADLVHGEAVATKIALIRAKANWVEHHYGKIISGRETLLVDSQTAQLVQTINSESMGTVPSLSVASLSFPSLSTPHLKINKRVKTFDGNPSLCIYLQAVK